MESRSWNEVLFHWQRYLAVAAACSGKRILEVGCGEGYGADFLATVAAEVLAIDISEEALNVCRRRPTRSNLVWQLGSATSLPCADNSVDVVIAFEMFEHVTREAQQCFLDEVVRVLSPAGIFVVSTPNRERTALLPPNPYHVRELSLTELRAELLQRFDHGEFYAQEVNLASRLWRIDAPISEFRSQPWTVDGSGTETRPAQGELLLPLYLLATCAKTASGVLPDLSSTAEELNQRPLNELWDAANHAAWSEQQVTNKLTAAEASLAVAKIAEQRAESRVAALELLRTQLAALEREHRRALIEIEQQRARISELHQTLESGLLRQLERSWDRVPAPVRWIVPHPRTAFSSATRWIQKPRQLRELLRTWRNSVRGRAM